VKISIDKWYGFQMKFGMVFNRYIQTVLSMRPAGLIQKKKDTTPYFRSKTIAEKAAWELKNLAASCEESSIQKKSQRCSLTPQQATGNALTGFIENNKNGLELTSICPGAVLGPLLEKDSSLQQVFCHLRMWPIY